MLRGTQRVEPAMPFAILGKQKFKKMATMMSV